MGQGRGRVSSQRRINGFLEPPPLRSEDCRSLLVNSLSPPLTSWHLDGDRRSPLVDDPSPPWGEHIGPPLLSDRRYREAAEAGDTEAVWDSHREYIDPSTCASQYRLPSEMEYPGNDWWAEPSRAENGDPEYLTSGNSSGGINNSLYQGPVYEIGPSQYPGGIDLSQYPGPVFGINPGLHQPVHGTPTGPRYGGGQYRQTFNGAGRYSYRRDRGGRGRYQGSRPPYPAHGAQQVPPPGPQGQPEAWLATWWERNNGGRAAGVDESQW